MRIIITAEPFENRAGLATFLLDSVSLFAQARPDWQFTLLALSSFSDAGCLEKHPNVKVVFCDQIGLRGSLSHLLPAVRGRERIFNLLAEKYPSRFINKQFGNLANIWEGLGHYDAVWVPHFAISQNRWPALYKPDTIKAPILLTIHDLHPAVFIEEWKPYPKMVDNFWNRFKPFAQQAPVIVAHSQFQKDAIVNHFGIAPEKIKVIYMPIPDDKELKQLHDEREVVAMLQQLGVREPFVFSPMSQGAIHKNHLRLIRAWALIRQQMGNKCPQLVFTARGSEDHYRKFNREIQKLDLGNRVVFTGLVSRQHMCMLYQQCAAVISPTLYESSCGLPILEALSMGKQVAGSDITPIREQMEHYNLSINYFNPFDEQHMAKVIIGMLQRGQSSNPDYYVRTKKLKRESRKEFVDGYIEQFHRLA
jgi:glycosyltransferase involved in cell wall biosynthesis